MDIHERRDFLQAVIKSIGPFYQRSEGRNRFPHTRKLLLKKPYVNII